MLTNEAKSRLESEVHELTSIKTELLDRVGSITQRLDRLSNENEELRMERDDCDRMRLDAIKKHDAQLKALNANLGQLRMELKQAGERAAQYDVELNVERGHVLELEAKLSNALEDRTQLVERCVNAENMCKQFKTQSVESKRRHEESESALQELAREHQTLQVKWSNIGLIIRGWSMSYFSSKNGKPLLNVY